MNFIKKDKELILTGSLIIIVLFVTHFLKLDSNIVSAILSCIVSFGISDWNIKRKKQENVEAIKNEYINNYHLLLAKINEFPSQLDEKIRFNILNQSFENRNLSIFKQMHFELLSYEKEFNEIYHAFINSWSKLDKDIDLEILHNLSDIRKNLRKLTTLISPDFVKNGLSETEKLKENIAKDMITVIGEIDKYNFSDFSQKILLESTNYLCGNIIRYQQFINAFDKNIFPLFNKEKDLTSSKIKDYIDKDIIRKISLPYENFDNNNTEGYVNDVIRGLMKLWGLQHDKANICNCNELLPNIKNRKIYFWREYKGNRIIHIFNGWGSNQFKDYLSNKNLEIRKIRKKSTLNISLDDNTVLLKVQNSEDSN